MIKSIVQGVVCLSMVLVPISAEARDRDHRDKSGISTGEAIALGLGALIVGAAIGSKKNTDSVEPEIYGREVPTGPSREVYDREYRYHYRNNYDRRTCYKEYQPLYDKYGTIVEYRKIKICY